MTEETKESRNNQSEDAGELGEAVRGKGAGPSLGRMGAGWKESLEVRRCGEGWVEGPGSRELGLGRARTVGPEEGMKEIWRVMLEGHAGCQEAGATLGRKEPMPRSRASQGCSFRGFREVWFEGNRDGAAEAGRDRACRPWKPG